jgi:myeloid differentiation primary response protein MyD88
MGFLIFLFTVEDAKAYLSAQSKQEATASDDFEVVKNLDLVNDIITRQDIECRENGLPLKTYDALVIYHDNDVEFASKLIKKCEAKGYSLCVKDRDLLAGFHLESLAMTQLVSARCNRLIIIVSQAFLNSPMQIYLTNFAQTLSIEKKERKIIPCLVEQCELPLMLRYSFRLDYFRSNKLVNFWDKLDQSLREPVGVQNGAKKLKSR